MIYFGGLKSASGKSIPMEVNTQQKHNCPKSTWGGGQTAQAGQTMELPQQQISGGQANANSMLMERLKSLEDKLSMSPQTAENVATKAHADHANIAFAAADIAKFGNKLDAIFDKVSDTEQLVQALLKEQGLFKNASDVASEEEVVKEGGDSF